MNAGLNRKTIIALWLFFSGFLASRALADDTNVPAYRARFVEFSKPQARTGIATYHAIRVPAQRKGRVAWITLTVNLPRAHRDQWIIGCRVYANRKRVQAYRVAPSSCNNYLADGQKWSIHRAEPKALHIVEIALYPKRVSQSEFETAWRDAWSNRFTDVSAHVRSAEVAGSPCGAVSRTEADE